MITKENILAAKGHLLESVETGGPKFSYLPPHLHQLEKWAVRELAKHSEADKNVVLTSVWLHDIGQIIGNQEIDHAINSETEIRTFLPKIGLDAEIIEKVARCARRHRCRDVQPETIEEKILAACDSASHMTDSVYIDIAARGEADQALAKLDRDLRDTGLLPNVQEEVRPLYDGWKKLLEAYRDWSEKND